MRTLRHRGGLAAAAGLAGIFVTLAVWKASTDPVTNTPAPAPRLGPAGSQVPSPTSRPGPSTTVTAAVSLLPLCDRVPPPSTETTECEFSAAYTTGYGWYDNTPPGSTTVSYPTIHRSAGGTGTYADPVTVAVGHSISGGIDTPEFAPGTRWYIPNLRRYFIVEDSCGDGGTPQSRPCWNLATANPGAQVWVDLWVDGRQDPGGAAGVVTCQDAITANHAAIVNPAPDYAVVPGAIDSLSGCTRQYGDTVSGT